MPVKNATFGDLSEEAFRVFKEKAVKSGRLKLEDVEIDNETLLKYLKALIHYEGMQRIEEYMFPRERL